MLSEEQRRSFKRKGYTVLQDVVPADVIERAQSQVWDAVPVSEDAPEEEFRGHGYHIVDDVADPTPFASIRRTVFQYAQALVGEDALMVPGDTVDIPEDLQLPINFPDSVPFSDTYLRRIDGGHVDGYGAHFRNPDDKQSGTYDYYTIGATVYLDQVKRGGGGFTVFPGSHWLAEQYYQDHSLESPGWLGQLPGLTEDGNWDYDTYLHRQLRARELTGPPGTVILWHMRLLHGAGINQRSRPRLAAVTRYTHPEARANKRDAVTNLWKYWEGMQELSSEFDQSPLTTIHD